MANSLDNVQRIVQKAFLDSLANATELYAECGKTLIDTGGQTQLLALNAGGPSQEVTGSTTSVDATDLTSGISKIFQRGWVKKHRLPRMQVDWLTESAIGDIGAGQANSAAADINKMYFDGLTGLFALNHPSAGTGAGQVGASKKFLDTGLKYRQGMSGEGTQDNLLTAALSRDTLNLARAILRQYKNQQGTAMNMGDGDYALIVGSANEELARQLLLSDMASKELQINTLKSWAKPIVYPLSNPDDWFVVDTQKSPVGLWIGEQPLVTATPSEDNVFINFVVQYQASFYAKAYEFGIIGANVE